MPGTQSARHETQTEKHPKTEPKPVIDTAPGAVSSLTGPALESAPLPLSPPGRLNPAGVRALQRTAGNRAVSQLLERGKPHPGVELTGPSRIHRQVHPVVQRAVEAGTTQEAIAIATTGPLKLLSDELAKPSPVAADILKYISQLGPGQRQIVQADEATGGILDKLAKCAALSSANMLAAVEMLNGPLTWSLKWINAKTGAAAAIGDAAYFRLVRAATSTQVEELLDSTTVAPVLITHYKGSPIDLLAPSLTPADINKHLANNPTFTDWVLNQAGALALMMHFKSSSPTAMILALKKCSKWETFLTSLPAGNMLTAGERIGLRLLFEATIADGDRAKIFEKRFGITETHTTAEWKTQGSSYWTAQESKEGAPLVPTTLLGKFKALFSSDSYKSRLTEELAKPVPDPASCLNLLSSLSPSEMGEVRDDFKMLMKFARVLTNDPVKIAQALARLDFPVPETVEMINVAGVGSTLDKNVYHRLLSKVDSAGLATIVDFETRLRTIKDNGEINPLTIPCLAASDTALAAFIRAWPKYSKWVIDVEGADTYLQYLAKHTPAQTGPALVAANKLDALLDELPGGFSLSPLSQDAMLRLCKAIVDIDAKKKLLKKRFELDDVSEQGDEAWTKKSIERMWELISRLPPALIKNALKELMRGTDTPGNSGFSGGTNSSGRVRLSFEESKMDKLEDGDFTSDGDKMRGHKIFDAGAIHEIGHAVDFKLAFSAVGSMLQTDKDLGAWKLFDPTNETAKAGELYDTLLVDSGNPIQGWTAQTAKALTREILLKAIMTSKKPSAAMLEVKNAKVGVNTKNWVETTFTRFIRPLKMTEVLEEYGDKSQEPWNTSFNKPIKERAYHNSYPNEWASYETAARGTSKLSNYQFRDNMEYFAEVFGSFYLTPEDPGKIVKAWNEKVYNWFVANVDKGYSTKKKA